MSEMRCPACGGLNAADSDWCGQCHKRFTPPPPPPPPATPARVPPGAGTVAIAGTPFSIGSSSASWTCGVCGTANAMHASFCAGCNVSFADSLKHTMSGPGAALRSMAASPWSGFGTRMMRGFRLIGVSWHALRMDPELMWLPVIGGMTIVALAFLLFGLTEQGTWNWVDERALDISRPLLWTFFVLAYFVSIYFQAAVVACALKRFDGGDPKVVDGLSAAAKKAVPLAGWAVIAGTVAPILHLLESAAQKSHSVSGRIAVNLVDLTWRVATYFVVPVILCESMGPGRAIKRSGSIFKQRWSETLAGGFGLGIALFVIMLGIIGVSLMIGLLVSPGLAIIFAMIAATALMIVGTTLGGVLNAALYRYAITAQAPIPFSERDLGGAHVHNALAPRDPTTA